MIILEAQAATWHEGLTLMALIKTGALLLIGIPVIYLGSRWLRSSIARRFSQGQGLLAGKILFWGGGAMLALTVLQQLGFQLTALLATLGIGGVAMAFAAQTSVSNVISGLFLLLENSFSVGDAIKVGDTTGVVLSIDLMSVKIRTFDNKFVRVPNESVVKTTVTNFSRFPIRRVDIIVPVAYRENLSKVKSMLFEVAEKNTLVLAEPAPWISFEKFGDSSIDLFLAVWAQIGDFLEVRNTMLTQIKERFEAEGIEIPFPQIVVSSAPGEGKETGALEEKPKRARAQKKKQG